MKLEHWYCQEPLEQLFFGSLNWFEGFEMQTSLSI
jgi:hypothetical protein